MQNCRGRNSILYLILFVTPLQLTSVDLWSPRMEVLAELRSVNEKSALSQVEELLTNAATQVKRRRLSATVYESLVYAVVDRVAPYISNRGLSPSCATSLRFDDIFLHGIDHIAFDVLGEALRPHTPGADVLARTAALFASTKSGGLRRLTSVVSHVGSVGSTPTKLAASFAHLPSRIANAAHSGANTELRLLDEKSHAMTLALAVARQPPANDTARDALVSALLAALVRLNHAPHVMLAWANENVGVDRALQIILLAPQQCTTVILRAILEQPRRHGKFALQLATELLKNSATARAAATDATRFIAGPLRRPRISVPRWISAMRAAFDEDSYVTAMRAAAETWGGKRYAIAADVYAQRMLTRVVLLHFRLARNIPEDKLSQFSVRVAEGVSHRLDHGDVRIRRYGMVVGEAFSRLVGDEKVLKFPREKSFIEDDVANAEEDGDSDFSDVANNDDYDCFQMEEPKGEVDKVQEPMTEELQTKKKEEMSDVFTCWEGGNPNDEPQSWELEDNWTDLESETTNDSEEEEVLTERLHATRRDYEEVRKKINAPMSVARVLAMLRAASAGTDEALEYDAKIVTSTLRTVGARAKTAQKGDAVYLAAADLTRAAVLIDVTRFPDDHASFVSASRRDAILALAQLDIENVGELLITDFAVGEHSDLQRRTETLLLLSEAVKALSSRGIPKPTVEQQVPRTTESGTVTRRNTMRKKQIVGVTNEYTVCAGKLFFLLANGLKVPQDHSILRPFAETEPSFYAHVLGTLAALLTHAGEACQQRSVMAQGMLQLAVRASTHGDASVRRAAALSAAGVAGATTAPELASMWRTTDEVTLTNRTGDGDHGLLEWLSNARENDPDVLVRRFASIALGKWQLRVRAIADGSM